MKLGWGVTTTVYITWSKGSPGGENLSLFLLNQIVHVIVANSSTLHAKSNTVKRS